MPSLFDHGGNDGEKGEGSGVNSDGEGGPETTTTTTSPVSATAAFAAAANKHLKHKSDGPKLPRSMQIDSVTVTFPLPAEDPLIHQRKAAELARALGK